jgi:hypothetical protein
MRNKMSPGHSYEIQSINIQLEELNKRIAEAIKDKKKRSHLVDRKKAFMTRKLEIEMFYKTRLGRLAIFTVHQASEPVPLWKTVVRWLGFRWRKILNFFSFVV